MSFYTYAHLRADDGQVFYIGKGKDRRAWRTDGRSAWWRHVVQKHGLKVQVLAEWPDEASAFLHEQLLIDVFQQREAPLVNLTRGGEGAKGAVRSQEFRRRVSEFHKGRSRSESTKQRIGAAGRGRKTSEETKAKLSQALCGRQVSAETRARIGAAHKGKVRTAEDIEKQRQTNLAKAPKIEAEGRSLSRREWALELGVDMSVVTRRLQKGLTPSGRPRA